APLQSYQPSYYAQPPQRPGLPTWALTVLFAMAFLGLGAGVYWTVGDFKNRPPSKPTTAVGSPAAKPRAAVNPVQRYIEVAGVRFLDDPKKKDRILVKFLIINHSEADFAGLAGNVTLWGSTKRAEEDAQGTFSFHTDLKPGESKELT